MSTEVNIATLKAHLSHYIRLAQKGEEIIVKDRNTPIARLSPHEPRQRLEVRPATRPVSDLAKRKGIRPKNLKPGDLARAIRADKEEWIDKWLASKFTSTRR